MWEHNGDLKAIFIFEGRKPLFGDFINEKEITLACIPVFLNRFFFKLDMIIGTTVPQSL